ncbi:MAG: extracellular solute-binding protein [Caldicoprobacterales bacterium]|jgi:putative aldouronate transport system substrate-binding protein
MNKRLLVILLACLLMISAAACGTASKDPTPTTEPTAPPATETETPDSDLLKETAKLELVYYGEKSNRMAEFEQNELKERLKQDLNVELTITFVTWDNYGGGKTDLMLSSGEDFASYTDPANTSNRVAKGFFADLTEAAEKYLPDLKKVVEPSAFDSFTINGRLYAIPSGNKPNSAEGYAVMVRQDLLEEVGMTEIKTLEDLEEFYRLSKEKHPDYIGTYESMANSRKFLSYVYSDKNVEFFGNFAFTDASSDDDTLYSFFETEEFKRFADINRRWVEMGIIPEYALSNPNQALAEWRAGKVLFSSGTAGKPFQSDTIDVLRKSVPDARLQNHFLNADGRPKINLQPWCVSYFVSAEAKDVDRYVMLFNYMQKNQEIVDFLTYGVEGKDYELVDGRVVRHTTDAFFDSWALENKAFVRFSTSVTDQEIENYLNWDNDSINAKTLGFTFIEDSVKTQKAKLDAVYHELAVPIGSGFLSYEENYDTLLQRLKEAGIDDYMAELQKQFTEFREAKRGS